jgi:hypothetical protein
MSNKNSSFKSFLTARNTRRGALSVAITVFIIAAVILLNIVVGSLSTRYSLYADLTANDAYRLQDATASFASTVDKDVTLTVLANETVFEGYGDYYVQANKLIRQLAEASPKITLSYVDLTTNPKFPSRYPDVDWSASHLVLVESGDRYRALDAEDFFDYDLDQSTYSYVVTGQHIEQALCSAILNLTAENLSTVAVLTGQGEQDMTAFTKLLTNNAYNVVDVDLVTGTIPEDADFLVIYAPSVDLDADMTDTIAAWLENNGAYGRNLLYFPSDKRDTAEYPNLNALIADWGMQVDFGYIYEADSSYIASALQTALCSRYDYADAAFTEDLPNPEIPVYLYYTMPVTITDGEIASPMLTSSEESFFGPMTAADDDSFTPDYHAYNGAAVGEKSDGTSDGRSSHVVVIGSYDALSSGFLQYNSYNNAAYFVNIFNTLADRSVSGVIIEGKKLESTALGADSAATVGFIAVLVRWVIPAAVLLAGLLVFFLRRHK